MTKPRPITELLADQASDPWVRAIQRGKKLQQLSRLIQNMLDPELGSHCQVLNLRDKTLILATDATVWATRLRYQIPTLLHALHQHDSLKEIGNIQIRVKPLSAPPAKKPKRRMTLSADSAYCLQQCAETVGDTALSRALQRLARRRRD
jgi:hypothetical protein